MVLGCNQIEGVFNAIFFSRNYLVNFWILIG